MANIKSKIFSFDAQITSHAICLAKVNAINMLNNARLFLRTQEHVQRYYGLDRISTIYDVYNIESEAIGQKIKYFKDDMPAVDNSDFLIKKKSDIYKIKKIKFNNNRCKFVLELIKLYKDTIGPGYKIRVCAPFSLAVNIRGFSNLINDIYTDKKFVKELFKIINYEVLLPWVDMQRGVLQDSQTIVSGADAWVAIPNVNLEILKNIIIPSYLELKSLVGNIYLSLLGGARYMKNPTEFLEIQRMLNPFLVKGIDPDVASLGTDFFVDFAAKNNMDLLLGIDSNFILNSNIDEIYKRIKKYIEAGLSQRKKFTLFFNDIPANISTGKLKRIFSIVNDIRKNKKKDNIL
jgi:hypothetical protein